jgi:hypothetical protein
MIEYQHKNLANLLERHDGGRDDPWALCWGHDNIEKPPKKVDKARERSNKIEASKEALAWRERGRKEGEKTEEGEGSRGWPTFSVRGTFVLPKVF